HVAEPLPGCRLPDEGGDACRVGGGARWPLLAPGRLDAQDPRLTIRLEVDSADELLVEQDRQTVVAVDALRRGRVDLDAVVEAPVPQRPGPIPDERIEWRQQRSRGHAPRHAGRAVAPRALAPALDRDRDE